MEEYGTEMREEEVDIRRRIGDLGSLSTEVHSLKIGRHTVYQKEEAGTGDRQTDSTAVTKDGRSRQCVRDRLELLSCCCKAQISTILNHSGGKEKSQIIEWNT